MSTQQVSHEINRGHLDLIHLTPLMRVTSGTARVRIGILDGPVVGEHSDLTTENIIYDSESNYLPTSVAQSAYDHGTFIAGVLLGRRGSRSPAICPDCSLLVHPIFSANSYQTTMESVAMAITAMVNSRVHVINVSASLTGPQRKGAALLKAALDHASNAGVLVITASGNQGSIGGAVLLQHPWVVPVTACSMNGQVTSYSNLGRSIARRGLMAPGDTVTSTTASSATTTSSGTSIAAPFVTGTIALLLSAFPRASPADVRAAVCQPFGRASILPPLIDAWGAYQMLSKKFAKEDPNEF